MDDGSALGAPERERRICWAWSWTAATVDHAMVTFAGANAEQNDRDCAALQKAVRDGAQAAT